MICKKLFILGEKLIKVIRISGPLGGIDFFNQRYLRPYINPIYHGYRINVDELKPLPNPALFIKSIRSIDQLTEIDTKRLRRLMTYSNLDTFQKNIDSGTMVFLGYYRNELCAYYCARIIRHSRYYPEKVKRIEILPGEAYLFDAEILFPFRRIGLGTAFIYEICAALFRESVRTIWCEIHVENVPSIHVHEKCGFRLIAKSTDNQ